MSISSPGLGSGLDITSLVRQLVSAEGAPKTALYDRREAEFQADITALSSLKSALSTFQETVSGLGDLSSFQERSATSSNTEVFTATAGETADESNYEIEVVQLAASQKLLTQDGYFSASTDTVGAGTLRFTQGADSFSLTISASDTLEDIRDAINAAEDNTGINAAIINVDDGADGTESKLVFTANATGLDNAITVEVDEDGNEAFDDAGDIDTTGLSRLINANLDEVRGALDGQIRVDEQLVSSSDNTFPGVIDGVTITALTEGADETLTVALNESSLKSKINGFLNSYNSLVNTFNELSFYDPDTESAGALIGDAALRNVQSSLRTQIYSRIDGVTTSFSTLAEIGVNTDVDGKLSLNEEIFDQVVKSDFDGLGQLFASDDGLANKLGAILDGYVSDSGIIESKTTGLQNSIDSIADQREILSRRLESLQARLLSQFSALDTLVSSLTTTSNFLNTQLANLPGAFDPNSSN